MQQKSVRIGEVDIPIIIDGGEEWFPISYISSKILLRKSSIINKDNKDKYLDHLRKYVITFGEKNIQETNCIDKLGLIEVLKVTQPSRLDNEQIKSQNELHNYLHIGHLTKFKNEDTDFYKFVDSLLNKEIKRFPKKYRNKNGFLKIIKYLYTKGILNADNLTINYLINDIRLNGIREYLSIEEIYIVLFGEDFYYYVWKYPKYSFRGIKLTHSIAIKIVNNYLKENKIDINNIFTFNYEKLFMQCGIKNLTNGNTLEFVVKFYNDKYPGYMFKSFAVNYYKNEQNLLFDLKYLIEEDMKIKIDKIPLYLTKNVLHKKSTSLYNYIITNRHGSLYKWINKLYPNRFIETDFEVNAYRDEFGSDTECFINEILNENFKNVIYNQIHTNRTIEINGMIPDWIIMTDNGVYLVEYFGLYEERQYGKSSRVTDYIDKANRKIEKYKEINGYKFLFFYPNDIDDDFKWCREKIAEIKKTLDT
jgi:DNA-binding ferritin-like protein (Dps family)